MSQRGAWDFTVVNHITEGEFGTTPTTGAWLPVSLVKRLDVSYRPVMRPKVGLGRQNPSDWTVAKKLYEFDLELELIKAEASPAYNWYTLVQYIIEKAATANGVPDTVLESFSLAATADLATDEFWWLKGCMLDRVELAGRRVDELVTATLHGLAQWGDYGTTDPVSGSATRQAQPAVLAQIPFGDCDVLYDPTTPASILDDVDSFRLSLIRELDPRGVATGGLYRTFVPKSCRWEVELSKDFDSKTELEHFIDSTKTKCTIEIPNVAGGKIFALTGGYWMPGSGLPVNELDLLNLRLTGEFATLAVSDHG